VRADFRGDLFGQIVARVVAEGYVGPLAREDLAHGRAEAPRPARDECTFPFQQQTQSWPVSE
jgi:hypothetical protein